MKIISNSDAFSVHLWGVFAAHVLFTITAKNIFTVKLWLLSPQLLRLIWKRNHKKNPKPQTPIWWNSRVCFVILISLWCCFLKAYVHPPDKTWCNWNHALLSATEYWTPRAQEKCWVLKAQIREKTERVFYWLEKKIPNKLKMKFYIQSIPSHSKQMFVLGKILLPVHTWNTGALLYTKDWKIWL